LCTRMGREETRRSHLSLIVAKYVPMSRTRKSIDGPTCQWLNSKSFHDLVHRLTFSKNEPKFGVVPRECNRSVYLNSHSNQNNFGRYKNNNFKMLFWINLTIFVWKI
jgi:hypothetical protein